MTWVLLRHTETGGAHLVPAGTEGPLAARGWLPEPLPDGLDAEDPSAPAALAEALALADAKRQAEADAKATKKAATAADKKE